MNAAVLLVLWIVGGLIMLAAEVAAWAWTDGLRGLEIRLQASYGAGPSPSWILRADTHLHIVAALLATVWFGLGARLFAPRTLPWLPVGAAVGLALSDELMQLGSAHRSFDWGDQAADAVGITLAVPVLILLRRLEVAAARRRRPL